MTVIEKDFQFLFERDPRQLDMTLESKRKSGLNHLLIDPKPFGVIDD